MNKKAVALISGILVVLIAVGAGYFFIVKDTPEETTAPTTETTTETTVSTTEITTTATTESTSAAAVTEDANAFLYKGYWYIYDDTETRAYALKFSKGNTVMISYFNTDNLDGVDAQYYKNGKAKYTLKDNKIKVTNIPDECEIDSIELDVRDSKNLNYKGVDGVNKDDLKLQYAFDHFNS
ncbi:MAG: hypothetical protein IJT65_08495 [Eubacterium sp.]|nr:hypothetical protein [Eubacterium sp.]